MNPHAVSGTSPSSSPLEESSIQAIGIMQAQSVGRLLTIPKLDVAGSTPVARSKIIAKSTTPLFTMSGNRGKVLLSLSVCQFLTRSFPS